MRRLTTDRRAVSPTFAPDGRRLAFVGVDGPTANLFELDLETMRERPLTAFTGDVQIPTARWSPDGARIALSLFDAEGVRDLATVDLATGEVVRLGTDPDTPRTERDDRLPVWNAAGDSLAFTSLRDRAPNAFVARTLLRPGRDVAAALAAAASGAYEARTAWHPASVVAGRGAPRRSTTEFGVVRSVLGAFGVLRLAGG